MARQPNDGMRRARRQEEREHHRHTMEEEEDRSNCDSEQSDHDGSVDGEDLGTLVSNSGQSRSNNDGMYLLFWGSVYHD